MRDSNEINQDAQCVCIMMGIKRNTKGIKNSLSLRLSVVLLQKKGSVESLTTKLRSYEILLSKGVPCGEELRFWRRCRGEW
jgi:hypothetical protein